MKTGASNAATRMKRRIGFHISAAGGLVNVPERAARLGCTAAQIFTQPPSQWRRRTILDEEAQAFSRGMERLDIVPYFVHAIYLLNLASGDESLRRKSAAHLAGELQIARSLGAAGVVVHLGSTGRDGTREEGIRRLSSSLEEARGESGTVVPLVLENSTCSGGTMGCRLDEIARILESARDAEPLRLCLDTSHAFGAGLAVHTEDGLEKTFSSLGNLMGLERLALIHFNDSPLPFASGRDRHWHIGKGEMGSAALGRILNHPLLEDIPFIMETPRKTDKEDLCNMRVVRRFLSPAARRLLPAPRMGREA
jgi:deoxyribonuclease-4